MNLKQQEEMVADRPLRPFRSEPVTVLAMGIVSVIVIGLSLDMGGYSSRFPLSIGIVMAVSSVLYGVFGPFSDGKTTARVGQRELVFVALAALLLLATRFVGFLVSSWIFVFVLHAYVVGAHRGANVVRSLLVSALVATVVLGIVRVVFVWILQIELP